MAEATVKINYELFLSRLESLYKSMLASPDLYGTCLQIANGKRREHVPGTEEPWVVSLQVRRRIFIVYLSGLHSH